jgi:hypothetical protein
MAMTATISLNLSTVLINQPTQATLTISNSSAGSVNVIALAPLVFLTGNSAPYANAVASGEWALGPGVNITVPASGSLSYSAPFVFFAPSTGQYGAGSGTFSIQAVCNTSDGSVFLPTAATVTVNPITLASTEQ